MMNPQWLDFDVINKRNKYNTIVNILTQKSDAELQWTMYDTQETFYRSISILLYRSIWINYKLLKG